ncbi:hypothetical protein [Kitasatospora purpeofusca]|uniref:hypothetical protein n=1 Tax=Kitasatospora purpeofusca TaxID=67352 RepID=UPI002254778B|nr:hypothetical protein [Kitasatospora purpeofusca]MCX4752893.1 hypothetical protein [Kitasatospora purpeofusca]WSR32437.1 hypothetical protein OG715_16475 [Kitasatospora purpeofusca]
MTSQVLTDVRLFVVGADLTSTSNKVELTSEAEEKDRTTYGSGGWKQVQGGLRTSKVTAEGLWEAGDPGLVDDATWAQLGGTGPWTVCPHLATVGSLAYLTQALRTDYTLGGAVGDLAPWSGNASGTGVTARGQIAHPPGTARTSNGAGTALQLGAVPDGRSLYAALHVLSAAGTTPSLTVRIESDDNADFTTATTRATFNAATGLGGQALASAGPVTDDWWRVAWTVSGTTPSFTFVAALGLA